MWSGHHPLSTPRGRLSLYRPDKTTLSAVRVTSPCPGTCPGTPSSVTSGPGIIIIMENCYKRYIRLLESIYDCYCAQFAISKTFCETRERVINVPRVETSLSMKLTSKHEASLKSTHTLCMLYYGCIKDYSQKVYFVKTQKINCAKKT